MGDMEKRQESVRLETPHHRIRGLLTLARDGYRSRISDLLNATERDFLVLTDVTIERFDGGASEHHAFVAVGRHHIVFAVSEADAAVVAANLDATSAIVAGAIERPPLAVGEHDPSVLAGGEEQFPNLELGVEHGPGLAEGEVRITEIVADALEAEPPPPEPPMLALGEDQDPPA